MVVFNARYGDYVDIAATEYFRCLFGGFQELLKLGLDNQVVSLSTNWLSSAKFDEVLCLSVAVTKIGNTSFALLIEFTERETNRSIATSEITYVMVDTKDYQKTIIPDWFRNSLQTGANGSTVNHAG
jgi:acyl-CoA thioester hydrolase